MYQSLHGSAVFPAPYGQLEEVVNRSGLWNGTGTNYRFLLSPDTYQVSSSQETELERIGKALADCLAGLNTMIGLAGARNLSNDRVWRQCLQLNRAGIASFYHGLQSVQPERLPLFCKVDFMEQPDGTYRIAEIDGYNKHGLGYSTLAHQLAVTANSQGNFFPGVKTAIAQAMRERGYEHLLFLYGNHERFYRPEFSIFANAMAELGIQVEVIAERERERIAAVAESMGNPVLLADFPPFHDEPVLTALLRAEYLDGNVDFLLPPKPWTSSKGVLAYLRNDQQDPNQEALLRDHISNIALDTLRQAIPETYMVPSKTLPKQIRKEDLPLYVLKEGVSSGMKGTRFTDDAKYLDALQKAQASGGTWILQREVENRACPYRYYAADGVLAEATWYQRVTVHYVGSQIADIVITARQDKRVHGAPDCLQLGAVRA